MGDANRAPPFVRGLCRMIQNSPPKHNAVRAVTSLSGQRVVLIALIVAIASHLAVARFDPLLGREWLQSAAESAVLVLLGSALVGLFWELGVRRAFLAEIVDEVQRRTALRADIESTGLIRLTNDFDRGVDWTALVQDADRLDLYWWAGRSWLRSVAPLLEAKASQKRFKFRLVLPDVERPEVLAQMARDSGISSDVLAHATTEAISLAKQLAGPRLTVYVTARAPRYPFMRLGSVVVFGTYSNYVGLTTKRPTLVLDATAEIGRQAIQEFEKVLEDRAITRTVWPP